MKTIIPTIIIIFLLSLAMAAQVPTPLPIPSPTPAELPTDVPPIAPNFEGENRALPSTERVGVDVANQLPLTLNEAIEMALENNNDIDASRNDVEIAEFNLKASRGVYAPQIASESYFESATTPTRHCSTARISTIDRGTRTMTRSLRSSSRSAALTPTRRSTGSLA